VKSAVQRMLIDRGSSRLLAVSGSCEPRATAVRRLLRQVNMPQHKRKFARKVPRALKVRSGRTRVAETPLRIRLSDVDLAEDFGPSARALLARRLGRFATHIERATVRIEDASNRRGGAGMVCRIKLTVSGRPSVLVEGRGPDAKTAFARAAASIARAMERSVERVRMPTPAPTHPLPPRRRTPNSPPATRPKGGSFIGRRVGRAQANLRRAAHRPRGRRDEWLDTSLPGVSETDRKAGGGSSAARNTKLRTRGMGYTLEDSARKPSRKSTRKSANRAKSGSKLSRRQRRSAHAPKARATRASVRR
jgi:hypothetical protein